jgi:drug/metabolite transporter (DMT)-like permease
MQNQTKGIIYAVITAVFWGVLAVALKVAVMEVDPVTIVWFRFSLAFTPLLIWHIIKRPEGLRILYRPPMLLVIATLALAYNYIGFMWGIEYTTPSSAQLFIQMGPILLTLAGVLFFREQITRKQMLGFLLALIGLLLFYNQQIGALTGGENIYMKGVLLTLSAAVAWSVYGALQKKLVIRYSTFTLNMFLFGLPTLLYIPLADFSQLSDLSPVMWVIMAFLGINTLVAYTTLSLSLKYLEAGKVSIIIIMNPLITFILMGILTEMEVSWIDGENFTPLSVIGAVIVIAGAILVVRKKRKPINPAVASSESA